jgi:chemosensory pili system protein ChpA (sensor histidine kinase/response regulator)
MSLPNNLELLASFVTESRQALALIREGFVAPSPAADAAVAMPRLFHTIKGTASILGLSPLSHLAYQLEELSRLPQTDQRVEFLSLALDSLDRYLALDLSELDSEANVSPLTELAAISESLRDAETHPPDHSFDEPLSDSPPFPEFSSEEILAAPPELEAETPAFTDPEPVLPPPEVAGVIDAPHSGAEGNAALSELPEWPETEEPAFAPPGAEPTVDPLSAISPEILEVFTAEAEEHLAVVGRTLPLLQEQPGNREYLQEVRRAAHTLKGAAASVGFTQLATLAHRAEDLLDLLYDGNRAATPDEIEVLFAAHDALDDLAAGKADETRLASLHARLATVVAAAREPTKATNPVEDVPSEEPIESEWATIAADAAMVRAAGEALRVPIARIDDVVKLVGELVISRSSYEQHLGKLTRLFQELQLSSERLQRATAKLETQYEARALGGNRLASRLGADAAAYGFDGLEFDRYTDFHLLTRELSETSTDIATVAQELSGLTGEFDGYVLRQSRLTAEMQDKLMRVRMVPLSHLSSRLHRTVRRTAAELDKPVRLVLEGENTDLDKTVLEEMSEPLLHLLRNAVDHGIEDAEGRRTAGKPTVGTIRVQALREGTQVLIRVSDDGRGIDPDRIRSAAVARGFLSAESAAVAGNDELFDLMFRAGFSTASRVSEISGRGVGLDAVKSLVERLKGTVAVSSVPGQGTTFTVRLPLTLAVIRALLVQAEEQTFALPLGAVSQILRLDPEQCGRIGNQDVVRIGEATLPRLNLAQRLGLRSSGKAPTRPPAVVLSVGDRRYVLVLDHILGGREVVVKSLGTHVHHAPGIAGATLLGDGSVVLILDPTEICTGIRNAEPPPPRQPSQTQPRPHAPEQLTVLIVDDSPSVRRIVSGQLREAGFTAPTAKDGLDALDILQRADQLPDALLLDVEMPRMDGYELLSTLRANPAYRHLPVVMLTSRAGDKHRRKAMELGATGYLVKPYQPVELLRVLRNAAASVVNV